MTTIEVKTQKPYKVIVGSGILQSVIKTDDMPKLAPNTKILIITDSNVAKYYYDTVYNCFSQLSSNISKYIVPAGENSKSTDNLIKIMDFLAERHFTRADIIIALGGGVVGDLAGFAASVYMRGIRYIQIPTTLLAATDSSVGGKTAVNLKAGKNLMGTFYQPELVICDYTMLDTLPEEIFSDGMAEVIKYGMIADAHIFQLIEDGVRDNLEEIIASCVSIKSKLAAEDEHDTGSRQFLNFGHTIAHAIEAASEYEISHGRAVGIGMHKITAAALAKGLCTKECLDRLDAIIKMCKLDIDCKYTGSELYERALSDKKRQADNICLVIPRQVGKCELLNVSVDKMREFF